MSEVFRSESYVLHADVTPVEALPGQYSFELSSQVLTAKNPKERRRLVQLTCEQSSLVALQAALHAAIAEGHGGALNA